MSLAIGDLKFVTEIYAEQLLARSFPRLMTSRVLTISSTAWSRWDSCFSARTSLASIPGP